VRDLVFLTLVVGFFAIAVIFVRACELVLGQRGALEETRER
jgi:hypothetical protein